MEPQSMLWTREHAVSRRWGTPTSPGRQAIASAYAQDTRACSEPQVGRVAPESRAR